MNQKWSDDELVDHYGNACLRTDGNSDGADWEELHQWREALKTRLRELTLRLQGYEERAMERDEGDER